MGIQRNIWWMPKRLLRVSEAAEYAGVSVPVFRREFPIPPVRFRSASIRRIDIKDLDRWIDALKEGSHQNPDVWLQRIGK